MACSVQLEPFPCLKHLHKVESIVQGMLAGVSVIGPGDGRSGKDLWNQTSANFALALSTGGLEVWGNAWNSPCS